jgi:Mrp family chromosome partitioning ATPase
MSTAATGKDTERYRLELASGLAPWNVPEPVRERFRKLRAVLCSGSRNSLCIGVCSHDSGEGVSWIASKLACAIAEEARSVVVLDANLSRPEQRAQFGISDIESVLPGSWNDNSRADAAGVFVATPSAATSSASAPANLLTTIVELRSHSPFVIVDCEPLGNSAQVLQLGGALDGILFVVEAEHHRRQVIGKTLELLTRAHIPVLGTILSKRKQYIPEFIYKML